MAIYDNLISSGKGKQLILLGKAGTTFDLTQHKNYQKFSVEENIILETPASGSAGQSGISESISHYNGSYSAPTASYNSQTGILTTTIASVSGKAGNNYSRRQNLDSNVYLIY